VCADWRGPLSDDDCGDDMERPVGMRPVGMRPVGMRPVGMRPVGMRPVGMRPVGMRPVGMRPVGMRPVGMRPVGMRPVGMRPVGMRPVGMRPVGMRDDTDDGDEGTLGYLDPDEWSGDVGALFCEYSAVLRLGARVVWGPSELPVPARPMLDTPRYLPEPVLADDEGGAAPDLAAMAQAAEQVGEAVEHTETRMFYRRLRPRTHELSVQVVMRNRLVTSMVERPEVGWAVKQDLASALAFRADQGFLYGDPEQRAPRGITRRGAEAHPAPEGEAWMETARDMLGVLRSSRQRFANPGWILHPATLEQLSRDLAANPPNDAGQLLTYDGADCGTLLGYPYVVSAAAADTTADDQLRLYFSSDWSEAWVGCEDPLATVDIAPSVRMATDETVVRAVTHHDFALRVPRYFIYSDRQAARRRRPVRRRGDAAARPRAG
jgi:HK97 family phage major capsid protein